MLHSLGKRTVSDDVVDQLVECHGRIRKFLGFARQLADKPEAPPSEVRAVASQIRRYFSVGLPLHIADEEELIAPRLASAGDEVARALATMHGDHAAHAAEIARLIALCGELEREPARLAHRAGELAASAVQCSADLEPHLELEERVVFPAIRGLPSARQDEIRHGMRARRETAP